MSYKKYRAVTPDEVQNDCGALYLRSIAIAQKPHICLSNQHGKLFSWFCMQLVVKTRLKGIIVVY